MRLRGGHFLGTYLPPRPPWLLRSLSLFRLRLLRIWRGDRGCLDFGPHPLGSLTPCPLWGPPPGSHLPFPAMEGVTPLSAITALATTARRSTTERGHDHKKEEGRK